MLVQKYNFACGSVWVRNLASNIREELKLRVLRRIFGPKRDEVTVGLRKLHNEELHNLYSSSGIIRMSQEENEQSM
jgi:hypothetical protein